MLMCMLAHTNTHTISLPKINASSDENINVVMLHYIVETMPQRKSTVLSKLKVFQQNISVQHFLDRQRSTPARPKDFQ